MTAIDPTVLDKRTPRRAQGAPIVRPRPAATLILFRHDGPTPRVLMGRRNKGHDFMPGAWVFPGGRSDPHDRRAPFATDLNPEAASVLEQYMPIGRARALALAAIRETYEEVGLILGKPGAAPPGAGPWREFLAHGAAPDLGALDVSARAITPPSASKRFDAWFFTADAESLLSLERKPDCGELEEIAWVEPKDVADMNLAMVTRLMLDVACQRLADRTRARRFLRTRHGKQGLVDL